MISRQALSIFRKLSTFAYYVGAFPFLWNTSGQYVPTGSVIKFYHWTLVSVYSGFNSAFMLVRLVQASCCMPGVTVGLIFLNFFSVATFITTSLFHLNTAMYHDEFPHFINELVNFNEVLGQTLPSHLGSNRSQCQQLVKKGFRFYVCKVAPSLNRLQRPRTMDATNDRTWTRCNQEDSAESFMKRIIVLVYLYSFGQFFIAYRTIGTNPKYVYTLIEMNRLPKIVYACCAALEVYISLSAASTLLVYLMVLILYVRSSRNSLQKLSQFRETQQNLRLAKNYRALQILNLLFSTIFRSIPMPAVFGTTLLLLIVSNYATFKLMDEVKMPAALGFPFISIAAVLTAHEAFPNSYRISKESMQLLRLMQHAAAEQCGQGQGRSDYIRKFLRSCRPLLVFLGPYTYVKKETILVFIGIGSNATFKMLML